ncbi:MAG: adenylate cyclase [Akkermansiaceae bacterium]|nr:adenylate cyclase [Armatimonadota bacterium]
MLAMNLLLPYHFLRAGWATRHLHGDTLQDYQDRKVREIIRYAALHSPFYRELWKGRDLDDWRNLPTVDKAAMMAHFGTFNTRGITKEEAFSVALHAERSRDFAPTVRRDVTVGLSSGTSGHRGAFLVSSAETAAWAGTVLRRVLHRLPRPGYRVAFFLRSNSNLYERIGGRVRFRWFDLMTPILEAVSALNIYAPDLLVGPPSLLLSLAEMAKRGLLTIRPERLVSVAETLEDQDKTELESTFGVPVGQVYQCTEGFLAATCRAGRLHINEDLVTIQYEKLDEGTGQPGQRVSPIITDLWRRTQPIIRYRLGDILTLEDDTTPCPCGSRFQVIRAVEGRCDDVCAFPDASTGELRRFYPDTIRRMILLADERVTDYAAVQDAPGSLSIHLAIAGESDFAVVRASVLQSATDILGRYGCYAERLEIVAGLPHIPPGVKRRRVISLAGRSAQRQPVLPGRCSIK